MFEAAVKRHPDMPAYINMGQVLTFRKLEERSRAFAAYLQNELRLEKGDRVALMMPNLLQYPIALFGALRAGLVIVNVNPLYTPRELEHQLNDSGAKAIVIVSNFAATLEKSGLQHSSGACDFNPYGRSALIWKTHAGEFRGEIH